MSGRQGYVGKGTPMRDAARFTRGLGRYVNDLSFTQVAHVAFARSTEAHAYITRLDTSRACKHPEAIGIFTAEDLGSVLKHPYWGGWEEVSVAEYSPLADSKVRWVGEPVAAIVAPNRYVAEDIAELVEVDYQRLPALLDPEKALRDSDALIYEEWDHNVYYHHEFEEGDVEETFRQATGLISRQFTTQRQTSAPLETRGIVASYDAATRDLTLHANFQDVFLARAVIARILDMHQSKVRVVAPDSGGGFGPKIPIYPEELACTCIAVLLSGAWKVKWIQDRQEDLIGTTQARDAIVDLELAHDTEGRIHGLKARIVSDAGAYGIPARGNAVEGLMIGEDLTGAYDIQSYAYTLDVVMTNKPPLHPYRGVALPMTIYFMDRMMDEVANATGLDRREVRRRNLIKNFPYESVTGWPHEPGSYVEALDLALEIVGFDEFPEYQHKLREQGRYVGLGIGTGCQAVALGATWYGDRGLPISSQEGCQISVDPGGKVHAQLGTTTQGQGIETVLAQLIADELCVPISDVTVEMGDTATASPYGSGAWASRQATLAGSACHKASQKIRDKLVKIAASQLEASPQDLVLDGGTVYVDGTPTSSITIQEIAHTAYFRAAHLPDGIEPALEETAHFEGPPATFSNATHAVVLEVHPETGDITFQKYVVVQDAGRILNPLIVSGQVYGGVAQGIGGVVFERVAYDEQGQPLATTFMDYVIPSSLDIPTLELSFIETPSPHTALGVKGMGESGTCFAPAAIATAVGDALAVEVNHLGLGPSKVFELMRRARK